MERLQIHRFRARYRLPSWAASERRRLDGILAGMVDDDLDRAAAELGIATDEEICIHRIAHRLRLRLGEPGGVLATAWSRALVEEIRQAIARGGDNVVPYPSRIHALVDLVAASARGDGRRAWALRQLGLPGEGPAGEMIVRA